MSGNKSTLKRKELTEHLFGDILKEPMISEYYPECVRGVHTNQQTCNTQHDPQHIGKCRYLCYNCSGTKHIAFILLNLHYYLINYRDGYDAAQRFLQDPTIFFVYRMPEQIKVIRTVSNVPYTIISFPICDSCKYVDEWKRDNWGKCVEKAIGGGANERKELRKIFYRGGERLAVRKLLTFFNCNTTIRMRDSLSGVIDYMNPM